jgi:hypothetical protein
VKSIATLNIDTQVMGSDILQMVHKSLENISSLVISKNLSSVPFDVKDMPFGPLSL